MGNQFEITIIADDDDFARQLFALAYEEIARIENKFTTYNSGSETFLVNENAGIAPVKVSEEFISIVKRAEKISALTSGYFDLSYGSLDKSLWNFDQKMLALPTPSIAASLVQKINYKNIIVDDINATVFLKEKGMRIGFGGIGKGYAADRAAQILKEHQVENALVNASGDIIAWGNAAGSTNGWAVGIGHPDLKQQPYSTLNLKNKAIATSGNYEKFVIIDGQKYSHTINPKTGLPVMGLKSVTIITASAELADALATPVTIMGKYAGLDFINQMNHIDCLIIDDDNKLYASKNIQLT